MVRLLNCDEAIRLFLHAFHLVRIVALYCTSYTAVTSKPLTLFKAVLRIRIRIRIRNRIHRIHMFLGLLDPDPEPLVRYMDPDPDPSINKQKW
jgi:hypothetical protein